MQADCKFGLNGGRVSRAAKQLRKAAGRGHANKESPIRELSEEEGAGAGDFALVSLLLLGLLCALTNRGFVEPGGEV